MAKTDTNMKSEINYSSIAAMMCGKPLTEEQRKDIEIFNREYDKAHDEKEEKH